MKKLSTFLAATIIAATSVNALSVPFGTSATVPKEITGKTLEEVLDSYDDKAIIKDEIVYPSKSARMVIFMDSDYNLHHYDESNIAYITLKYGTELPVDEINAKLAEMYDMQKTIVKADNGYYRMSLSPLVSNQEAYALIKTYADILEIKENKYLYEYKTEFERYFAINSDLSDEEIIAKYPGLKLSVNDFTKNNPMDGYNHLFSMDWYGNVVDTSEMTDEEVAKMTDEEINEAKNKTYAGIYESLKELNANNEDFYFMCPTLEDSGQELSNTTSTVYKTEPNGDVNNDDKTTLADCVTVLQYLSNADKYPLTIQGKFNADVDGEEGITGTDALAIQMKDAEIG